MRGLYFTNDLMFSSRILSAAQSAGLSLSTVMSAAALTDQLTSDDIGLVIIDLASPGADVAAIVAQVRAVSARARIIAYGPHVDHARLDAAAESGCDQVFSRGQFMQDFPALLEATLE